MARTLFSRRGDNWVGEFPPPDGWQAGRRGMRRTLCRQAQLAQLNADEQVAHLGELYQQKLGELQASGQQARVSRQQKKRAERDWRLSQAQSVWLAEVSISNGPATVAIYQRTLKYYREACGDHRLRDFDASYNLRFWQWLQQRQYRGRALSAASINKHLRQLAVFLRWGYERGVLDRLPSVKKPSVPRRDMDTYKPEQLTQLLAYLDKELEEASTALGEDCSRRAKSRYRNALNLRRAMTMAAFALLRLGAIWSLPLAKIDLARGLIQIRDNPELDWSNKGDKQPDKPISEPLQRFIEADLNGRGAQERYWLDNGSGQPWRVDRADISRLASSACRAAGLPKVKPFHWGARASGITALLAQGVSPVLVQQLADHSDLSTTLLYLNRRALDQRQAADALANVLDSVTRVSPTAVGAEHVVVAGS